MLLYQFLSGKQLKQFAIVIDLQFTMLGMHIVELSFKLEAKLDFLLMVLLVAHILVFKLQAVLFFLISFLFEEITLDLLILEILLHYLLLVFELLNLVTVNLLIRLESLMVPVSELSDQNSVVCLAAILK